MANRYLLSGRAFPTLTYSWEPARASSKSKNQDTGVCEIKAARPYQFIGFGATNVTKPYEIIWLSDIDGPEPYEFIRSGGFDFANTGIGVGRVHTSPDRRDAKTHNSLSKTHVPLDAGTPNAHKYSIRVGCGR